VQGSLGEFRLAEILQLVAVQQKTGLLRLVRGEEMVVFYFDRGILVSTRDRRHGSPDPLLDYLTRTGWLETDIAGFLRTRMENSKDDVAQVLLAERFLNEDELRGVLEDLAQELVSKTFAWRSGTYQFIGGDNALSGLQHRVSLPVDSLLMEAARRADEWPRFLERLPGPDVILEVVQPPRPQIGDRSFEVLSRITGRTTLGALVQRCRTAEFEVYEIVAQALEAGAVRVEVPPRRAAAATQPLVPPTPVHRSGARRRVQPALRAWAVALAVVLLAAAGSRLVAPELRNRAVRTELRQVATAEARAQLRLQIEIYRAAHGRYPEQLADLVTDELASTAQLARAAPVRYATTSDRQQFQLTVPPAGGESATR